MILNLLFAASIAVVILFCVSRVSESEEVWQVAVTLVVLLIIAYGLSQVELPLLRLAK